MEVANRKLIEIDLRKPNKIPKYEFFQGDTNIIEFEVLDSSMRANLSAVSQIILNLTRRDNRTFSRILEAFGNVITLQLSPSDMEIVGTCDIVLQFFNGDKRLSTVEFQIYIKQTVNPDFNFEEGEPGLVNQIFDQLDKFNDRLANIVIEGGGVPLSSSLTSTSESTAATSKAVKDLNDRVTYVQNSVRDKAEKSYVDNLFEQIQDGAEGKSAYEIAVENGFNGTEQQWLNSLKGQNGTIGIDGKSAYQSWLDLGNTGTERDFITSLKGQDGVGTSISLSSSLTSTSTDTAATSKAAKDLNDKIDILTQQKNQLANQVEGTVKKVNNVTPDEYGNVTIEVPQIDTSALATKQELNTVNSQLADKADKSEIETKYTKPVNGIPKSDLAADVQNALENSGGGYVKPQTGIPRTDLAQDVQTQLTVAATETQRGHVFLSSNLNIAYGENYAVTVKAIKDMDNYNKNIVENVVSQIASLTTHVNDSERHRKITISTANPTGGQDGDLWFKYE